MERFICVHGHFYQPPRENPWLEFIEVQDSAYPDHDWNERVDRQCYGPNAAARIIDSEGQISKIVNNYARMSFNIGPTLFAWLEVHDPEAYRAILSADAESRERFSGHGSAIAQPYNHMILPLANRRDKSTQVSWGIRDFERRFKRRPEGMWLPETAVDVESLEVLEEQGVRFTILGQHQAEKVRDLDASTWEDVRGSLIDATRAYRVELPSGKAISVFFYDEALAKAVAFEGILHQGEHLANRLLSGFNDSRRWSQLVSIAADGETYGHHHRFGEMALAYALDLIEASGQARLTNYAAYLAENPPQREVRISPNTSWSCAHGIERWRSNCGCQTGGKEGSNQAWRTPLRDAFDSLRDRLAPRYEEAAAGLLKNPWGARDDYIDVILDRSRTSVDAFLEKHAISALDEAARRRTLRLLETQRNLLLMYTSCGWFFNDLAGIETVQVLRYAARAVQLAEDSFGETFAPDFLARLEHAKSNVMKPGDGRTVYDRMVLPSRVDLERIAAHYALRSFFESFPSHAKLYCYSVDLLHEEDLQAGEASLRSLRLRVRSDITEDATTLGVLAFRIAGQPGSDLARILPEGTEDGPFAREVADAFRAGGLSEVIDIMNSRTGGPVYSARSLLQDEQRKLVDAVLWKNVASAPLAARALLERTAPIEQALAELATVLPPGLGSIHDVALSLELRAAIEREAIDTSAIVDLLAEAEGLGLRVDLPGVGHALERTIILEARRFAGSPENLESLKRLEALIRLSRSRPFGLDLWEAQKLYYGLMGSAYPMFRDGKGPAEVDVREWLDRFRRTAHELSIRVS